MDEHVRFSGTKYEKGNNTYNGHGNHYETFIRGRTPRPHVSESLQFLVAMRMRVLAACAAPHSLQDWLLNTTLLSLFSFILLLRLRPGSPSPRTSARLGLSYAKLNVLIIHVKYFYSNTRRSAGRCPGPPL